MKRTSSSRANELEMRMRDLQQKIKSVLPWNAQSLADDVDELNLECRAAALRNPQFDSHMRDLSLMLMYIPPLRLSYDATN